MLFTLLKNLIDIEYYYNLNMNLVKEALRIVIMFLELMLVELDVILRLR